MQSSDLQPTLRNVTFSAHFSLQIVSSHSSAKIVLSSAFVFQQVCSLNSKCRSADFLFDQLFLRYLFPMHFTGVHFCLQVGILFPVFRSLFISQASHKYPKVWADYKEKSKLVATVKHILTTFSPAYCFTAKQVQPVFFSLEYEQVLERDVGGNCTETLQL